MVQQQKNRGGQGELDKKVTTLMASGKGQGKIWGGGGQKGGMT